MQYLVNVNGSMVKGIFMQHISHSRSGNCEDIALYTLNISRHSLNEQNDFQN